MVTKHYQGVATCQTYSNSVTVTLPSSVDTSRSFPLIQVRNNSNDSTWGGSAGNVMFTAKFGSGGATLVLERARSWEQAVVVDWEVVEFVGGTVVTKEVVCSGSGARETLVFTPAELSADHTIFFKDVRSVGTWNSDTTEYLAALHDNRDGSYSGKPVGVYLQHKLPQNANLRVYAISQLVVGNLNYKKSTNPNATTAKDYTFLQDSALEEYGFGCRFGNVSFAAEGALSSEPNQIPNFTFNKSGVYTNLLCRQYVPKNMNYAGRHFVHQTGVEISYHGETVFEGGETEKIVVLPKSVVYVGSLVLLNAPWNNLAQTNTYAEEFGDMSVSASLVNRGDGWCDTITLKRGNSGNNVSARISWTVLDITGTGIAQLIPILEYYYRRTR